jgi:anti-sigma B factor antagonist
MKWGSDQTVAEAQPLRLQTDTRGTVSTVSVCGDLDLATAPTLDHELRRVTRTGPEIVVLDLSAAAFISTSGVHVILKAEHRLRADGRRLVIVPAVDRVHRIFRLTEVEERLAFVGQRTV